MMKCVCGHSAKYHEGWPLPGSDESGCSKYVPGNKFCDCKKWRPVSDPVTTNAKGMEGV